MLIKKSLLDIFYLKPLNSYFYDKIILYKNINKIKFFKYEIKNTNDNIYFNYDLVRIGVNDQGEF